MAALLQEAVVAEIVAEVEAEVEPPSLSLPRFPTFCSTARGVATAKPKREENMTVERMAMQACEQLSCKKLLLEDVFVLTV